MGLLKNMYMKLRSKMLKIKYLGITNLAITAALTSVENKILDVIDLVK